MVERIRELLQVQRLSPTQFADTIGVARPIISHILGGRNKPSLEVVQKIIAAFPDIALPWLLSGHGPMNAQQASDKQMPTPSGHSDSAPQPPPPALAEMPRRRQVRATVSNSPKPPMAARMPAHVTIGNEIADDTPVLDHSTAEAYTGEKKPAQDTVSVPGRETVAPQPSPAKAVSRIVVFYQDGTFAEYRPGEGLW